MQHGQRLQPMSFTHPLVHSKEYPTTTKQPRLKSQASIETIAMLETMKCKAKVSSLQVSNYKQYNDGVID